MQNYGNRSLLYAWLRIQSTLLRESMCCLSHLPFPWKPILLKPKILAFGIWRLTWAEMAMMLRLHCWQLCLTGEGAGRSSNGIMAGKWNPLGRSPTPGCTAPTTTSLSLGNFLPLGPGSTSAGWSLSFCPLFGPGGCNLTWTSVATWGWKGGGEEGGELGGGGRMGRMGREGQHGFRTSQCWAEFGQARKGRKKRHPLILKSQWRVMGGKRDVFFVFLVICQHNRLVFICQKDIIIFDILQVNDETGFVLQKTLPKAHWTRPAWTKSTIKIFSFSLNDRSIIMRALISSNIISCIIAEANEPEKADETWKTMRYKQFQRWRAYMSNLRWWLVVGKENKH